MLYFIVVKPYVYDGVNELHFYGAVLFSQGIFRDGPQVFYRIEVWRVAKPFQYFHFYRLEIWRNNLGVVAWGRFVLRNGLMMEVSRFSGDSPFYYWQIGFDVHHPLSRHKCSWAY